MPGINISFNDSDIKVIADLEWLRSGAIANAMLDKMTVLMKRLENKVRNEKLSGQVLERQSGALADSIKAQAAKLVGTEIVGEVDFGGGEAFYGQLFELGLSTKPYIIRPLGKPGEGGRGLGGTRSHRKGTPRRFGKDWLRFIWNGKEVFAKAVLHPPIPKKPFMQPALEEMYDQIISELRATLLGAMRQKR